MRPRIAITAPSPPNDVVKTFHGIRATAALNQIAVAIGHAAIAVTAIHSDLRARRSLRLVGDVFAGETAQPVGDSKENGKTASDENA